MPFYAAIVSLSRFLISLFSSVFWCSFSTQLSTQHSNISLATSHFTLFYWCEKCISCAIIVIFASWWLPSNAVPSPSPEGLICWSCAAPGLFAVPSCSNPFRTPPFIRIKGCSTTVHTKVIGSFKAIVFWCGTSFHRMFCDCRTGWSCCSQIASDSMTTHDLQTVQRSTQNPWIPMPVPVWHCSSVVSGTLSPAETHRRLVIPVRKCCEYSRTSAASSLWTQNIFIHILSV